MVKLVLCRRCGDIVNPRKGVLRKCVCENVVVKYADDGMTLKVRFKDMGDARIVGISNSFLQEREVPFDDPSYDNTMFQIKKSPIVILFPFTTGDIEYLSDNEAVK